MPLPSNSDMKVVTLLLRLLITNIPVTHPHTEHNDYKLWFNVNSVTEPFFKLLRAQPCDDKGR